MRALVCSLVLIPTVHPLLAGDLRIQSDQRILLLTTERTSTMQEELDQAVERGFSVIAGASARQDEIAYLLTREDTQESRGRYLLLATRRLSTMQEELNNAAAHGYRLHPESILYNDCELILLMEPQAIESPRYEYLVLGTRRTSTLQRELAAAIEAGFRVVDLVSADENVAVLERELAQVHPN